MDSENSLPRGEPETLTDGVIAHLSSFAGAVTLIVRRQGWRTSAKTQDVDGVIQESHCCAICIQQMFVTYFSGLTLVDVNGPKLAKDSKKQALG